MALAASCQEWMYVTQHTNVVVTGASDMYFWKESVKSSITSSCLTHHCHVSRKQSAREIMTAQGKPYLLMHCYSVFQKRAGMMTWHLDVAKTRSEWNANVTV